MNPSPACIAYILARSPDWSRDDASISESLNAETAPNPVASAPTVPRPFGVADLMLLLSAASLGKVYSRPAIVAFRDDCNAMNRFACGNWIALAQAAGDVTQAEHDSMLGVLSASVPDPSWTSTVPAPLVALGRVLDPDDVAASRPGS